MILNLSQVIIMIAACSQVQSMLHKAVERHRGKSFKGVSKKKILLN